MVFAEWMAELFPYLPRKNQEEIIQKITDALIHRRQFIFESGTGSGKTICVLAATLTYALENNKKIIYSTRTNAQQQQVILELRAIKRKSKDTRIYGVGMQGRGNMCLLAQDDPEIQNGNSEELSKFCSYQKKLALSEKGKGCSYYRKFLGDKDAVETIREWTQKHLPTAEEFIDTCEKQGLCPYEINKLIVHDALVVVVPYVYVFDKSIRIKLFDWLSISEEDVILVVDEAHNLPDYLRELFSAELSTWMLTSCLSEADQFGNPSLADGRVSVTAFCKELMDVVNVLRDTYIYGILEGGIRRISAEKNDAMIPSHELEVEILSRVKPSKTSSATSMHMEKKFRNINKKEENSPAHIFTVSGCSLVFGRRLRWTNTSNSSSMLVKGKTRGWKPFVSIHPLARRSLRKSTAASICQEH
jgi:Rad3-related DNA helicase